MSEQDRIAFEAWYDNDISEPLPDDYTILGKRYLYMGWCAATAEANKRIESLESEVAELKERIETHIAINKSLLMQRDELQADNKRLREGVAIIKNSSDDLNTITQLQANNHALREALIVCKQYITEAIIDDKYHEASCSLDELYLLRDKAINLYNAAIAAPRE